MRVALINPGSYGFLQPPLGISYIASYLVKYGDFTVKIFDENAGDTISKVKKFNPDIIGVSATTFLYVDAMSAARQIRDTIPEVPIVIGGNHITALPESSLRSGLFDIGVLGEGELTMLELVNAIKDDFSHEKLKSVDGIAFMEKGNLIKTPVRNLIKDLDRIPFPSRELLNMKYYSRPKMVVRGVFDRTTQMMTSRGCPYNCTFCASEQMWQRKVRFFSPEYVIDEIKELIEKYKIKTIYFQDDTFCLNRKRVKRMCELMREEGISEQLEWSCQMRANLVDRELLKDLKSAGCIQAEFGFESYSPKVLTYIKKGNVTVEQNLKAVKLCKEEGLRILGNFVIGSPIETEEDLLESFRVMDENEIDFTAIHILTPFPGSELWHYGVEKGLLSEDMDWSVMHTIPTSDEAILITESMPKERLFDLFKEQSKKVDMINKKHLKFSKTDMLKILMTEKPSIKGILRTVKSKIG